MDKIVSQNFEKHPAMLDFGKNFIKFVYDDSIYTFLEIYEIKTSIKKPFGKEIQLLISTFSDEQLKKLDWYTKTAAFFAANLELNFFERHLEYNILVKENQERVALSDITGELRKHIMGIDGLLAHNSKYDVNLEEDADFYLVFHPEFPDTYSKTVDKAIPEYLLKRPAILDFIKVYVNEVYDYAITQWSAMIDGRKESALLKEILSLFSKEQMEALKKLGKLIIEDSFLKTTGLFEGFDYWLITRQDGKKVHISYTDPEEEDFERNELAFDMHNEEIINLFSKYGLFME